MPAIAQGALPPKSRWRRPGYVAAGLAAAAVFIWDEWLLAAPVIGLTKLLGAGLAFIILAPVYFGVSVAGALLAVGAYERASAGESGRIERWLNRQAESSTGRRGRRLVQTTSGIGFVLSSIFLGGIVTTWFVRLGGRREGLLSVALASSALFAVGLVGGYSGLFGLIFS